MSGTNLPAPEVPTIVSGTPPAAPEPIAAPSVVETPTIITPSSAPVELPVAETVVVEPVAAEPVVEGAEKPAETPAPAEGGDAKPELHTDKPTLLETKEGEAKPEAKPDAAKDQPKLAEKAAAPAKPDTKDAAAETKPEPLAPVEYKYTLPETIKMDDALKGRVHAVFDEFRADPSQGAQKLIDLHNEMMGEYAKQTLKNQFDVFNATCRDKEKLILADPEFGGAGHETAKTAVARARDALISSARPGTKQYDADLEEFEEFNSVTGAGSWPAFWRMLHNAARFIDEPQARNIPTDIKPPKTNGRSPRGSMYSEESRQKMNGIS